jgi:hypothetical protein
MGGAYTSFGTPLGNGNFGTPLAGANGFNTPLGGSYGVGTPLANASNGVGTPMANAVGQQALQRGFAMLTVVAQQLQNSQLTANWTPVQMLSQDVQLLIQTNQNNSLTPAQKNAIALQVLQQSVTDLQTVMNSPNLPTATQSALSGVIQQMQQAVQVAQQCGMGNGAATQAALGY